MQLLSLVLIRVRNLVFTFLIPITIIVVSFGLVPIAMSPEQPSAPGGFDYWQPDWMVRELWGPGRMPKGMMVRLLRHTTYMQYGVPSEYQGVKSTVTPGQKTIATGKKIYKLHCAQCHGTDGLGGGKPEHGLSPSPALLAFMIRRPISVDEYLLWAISDGGQQFETKMPAFKDVLSREDIWSVVAYMRAGFSNSIDKPVVENSTD